MWCARYNLGADHARDKERFAQKEREEAVKKARERRLEDFRAKEKIRKQIRDDRRLEVAIHLYYNVVATQQIRYWTVGVYN